jgi:hypothetical protein
MIIRKRIQMNKIVNKNTENEIGFENLIVQILDFCQPAGFRI